MKKILLAAIMAGSLFACNKQDVTNPEIVTGENSVNLTINQNALTKGISDQKGANEYAIIGSGRLFFIDNSGNSIFQRELTTAEITAIQNTSSTAGDNTITITGVPNTATTLFFMANIKTTDGTSYNEVEGTTGADARLRIDKLQANVNYVPMSGQSTAFTGSNKVYTANVTLTPIVARIEVIKTTCNKQNGSSGPNVTADITGYNLSGVYVNSVREYTMLSGAPYVAGSMIDIRNQSGWNANWAVYFNSSNTKFPYFAGGSVTVPTDWVDNALVDYCTPATPGLSFYPNVTSGSSTTAPATSLAWAYQVTPSTTVAVGTPADVPHLILKLTGVTYVNNPLGLPTKYVTITKYKDASNAPVLEFKKGNVYRIENLEFTHNQATNQPYEENISVTATVSVAPWVINTITPDWN